MSQTPKGGVFRNTEVLMSGRYLSPEDEGLEPEKWRKKQEIQTVSNESYCGSTPYPVTVANEGLSWNSFLNNKHVGGDWHPG